MYRQEAVVEPDLGGVGGAVAGRVQALARLHADDAAVGVDGPLLVGAAKAVPDLDLRGVGGARAADIQALGDAGDGDLQQAAGGQRPLLVWAAPAVVELHLGAVGVGYAGDVEAPSGVDPLQAAQESGRGHGRELSGELAVGADVEHRGVPGRRARTGDRGGGLSQQHAAADGGLEPQARRLVARGRRQLRGQVHPRRGAVEPGRGGRGRRLPAGLAKRHVGVRAVVRTLVAEDSARGRRAGLLTQPPVRARTGVEQSAGTPSSTGRRCRCTAR